MKGPAFLGLCRWAVGWTGSAVAAVQPESILGRLPYWVAAAVAAGVAAEHQSRAPPKEKYPDKCLADEQG